MKLDYNIFFELAVLPFDIIMFAFLFIRRAEKTEISRRFHILTGIITAADIADILTAVILSQHTALPNFMHSGITMINCILSALSAYGFVWYIYAYVLDENKQKKGALVNNIVFLSLIVLVFQNIFTGNVFYYNENAEFVRGFLFMPVAYLYPVFYILHGVVVVFGSSDFQQYRQKISLIISLVVLNSFYVIQIVWLSDVLFTYFTASIALMIMFMSIEATDYVKLGYIMKEVDKAREQEAAAKVAALEANAAKTKFLSQMSHEIRTPINAIMGYSSLIMDDTEESSTREYSRKAKLAARRLLDFFESIFEFIAEEGGEDMQEIEQDFDIIDDIDENNNAKKILPAESLRILVVDDTEMNVELLTRILAAMGFQTDSAPDGEKAVEKLRTEKYDLVFMDHMMPVMDGMEAIRIIKAEELCPDTPVIMLTANTVKGEREKYLNAGFDEYITKPFSDSSIRNALLKYLPVDEDQLRRAEWPEEWRALQKSLPFLRISAAKEYCLSDKHFYTEMLKAYVVNNVLTKLEEALESGDYFNYRAYLASLKDTSVIIGADKVCEKAAALERYYLKGNFEEIKIEETKKLIRLISEAMFINDSDVEAASKDSFGSFDARPLVLVIDDERVVSMAIEKILSKYYRVRSVSTGEEGVIKAQEYNPALIMLDIKMSGLNGFDVFRALRSVEETAEIPVVFMTSDDSAQTEAQIFKSGADDFIRKPVIPDVLVKRVHRIIELSGLRKYLRHEITRQTDKVAHLSREVMLALSKAVDAKDHYTNDHSQRVAKYSAEIAGQLGKTKEEQDDIFIMGLLHDVGKIGVNEDIINKPSRLTADEYEQVKRHTVIGYEILKIITEMPDVAKAARWHHERYDGKGYPDGLAGTEIPEEARIICVADSYDAMTSRRPYQGLREQADVRAEIIRCKGTQFDPTIADAMVRIIDDDKDYVLHE